MESILTSIKGLLGITEECTDFDAQIIIHINTVFSTLTQLGVGPAEGFVITGKSTTWSEFIPENSKKYEFVKMYVFLRVKLDFDPSSLGSATLSAYERRASELEWRLNVEAETPVEGEEEIQNGE